MPYCQEGEASPASRNPPRVIVKCTNVICPSNVLTSDRFLKISKERRSSFRHRRWCIRQLNYPNCHRASNRSLPLCDRHLGRTVRSLRKGTPSDDDDMCFTEWEIGNLFIRMAIYEAWFANILKYTIAPFVAPDHFHFDERNRKHFCPFGLRGQSRASLYSL